MNLITNIKYSITDIDETTMSGLIQILTNMFGNEIKLLDPEDSEFSSLHSLWCLIKD